MAYGEFKWMGSISISTETGVGLNGYMYETQLPFKEGDVRLPYPEGPTTQWMRTEQGTGNLHYSRMMLDVIEKVQAIVNADRDKHMAIITAEEDRLKGVPDVN